MAHDTDPSTSGSWLAGIKTLDDLAAAHAEITRDVTQALIAGNFMGLSSPESNKQLVDMMGSLARSGAMIEQQRRRENLPHPTQPE